MRNRRVGVLGLTILLSTCSGIDNFDIEESSTSTIPAGSPLEQVLGNLGFGNFLNLDITQNQTLQNQGVTKDQIDSVHITKLTLRITSPASGQDFTFISSLKFYVGSEGLERALIASGGPFPSGASTIDLTVENVDLAPYVAAPSLDITTEANGRRPNQETTVEATIDLDVDVNVGGVICG